MTSFTLSRHFFWFFILAAKLHQQHMNTSSKHLRQQLNFHSFPPFDLIFLSSLCVLLSPKSILPPLFLPLSLSLPAGSSGRSNRMIQTEGDKK